MPTDSEQFISRPFVLVVGAGINGAAVVRELTLNGVSVVVVDANDVAFGATSRSSRLIHGGLRYLERGDFALVRESLRQRTILLKTAATVCPADAAANPRAASLRRSDLEHTDISRMGSVVARPILPALFPKCPRAWLVFGSIWTLDVRPARNFIPTRVG